VTMMDVIELNRLFYQLGVRIKTLHEVLCLSVHHHTQSGDLYCDRRTARPLRKTVPINSLFRGVRVFTPSSSRCKRGSYPSQLDKGYEVNIKLTSWTAWYTLTTSSKVAVPRWNFFDSLWKSGILFKMSSWTRQSTTRDPLRSPYLDLPPGDRIIVECLDNPLSLR
jgi:hypothetical protein